MISTLIVDYRRHYILSASECEIHIEQLQRITIENIGSEKWQKQHQILEKLNIQAHLNVQNQSEEFVAEHFILFDKVPVLIYDLLVIETWKTKVFPLLYKDVAKTGSLMAYMLLYHEATIVNLLEIVLYNKDALLSAGDTLLDLVDYCTRKIATLCAWEEPEEEDTAEDVKGKVDKMLRMSEIEQLQTQKRELDFVVSMTSLSLLRYMTDHITELPLSTMTRILNTNDLPVSLIHCMDKKPWQKKTQTGWKRFENSKWVDVNGDDILVIGKIEAQVWLSLYNLLVEPECQKKYEVTDYRRSVLLKLRPFFQIETLLDQLPILEGLYRYTENLAITIPPHNVEAKLGLLVEQVPEILESIIKGQNWSKLAQTHKATIFNDTEESRTRLVENFASLYDLASLESLLDDPKCAKCGNLATQRCSRCRSEWYCSRPCQVKSWKAHKTVCDVLCAVVSEVTDKVVAKGKTDGVVAGGKTVNRRTGAFIKELN
ncbi:zinc finger MYND domain-containing protein 10-like protein [Paraphysoderma sedebokerense]|nr:zinc finger MYND domain-containing protein 10-like protein [Paraphysoderma sedebokerense]